MINLQLTLSYLSVGMKSELVLSEEKRNQRFAKSISLKKMKIDNPALMVKRSKRPIKPLASEVSSVKPIVSVSPITLSNSSSTITSLTAFSPPETIQESPKKAHEMCSIPILQLSYENDQTQSNNLEAQIKKNISTDETLATVGRRSVIVNKPSTTATVDTQICGTATSVIKMPIREPKLTTSKGENIPNDTGDEIEVVDISQDDEVNPINVEDAIIENHPNGFQKLYIQNTENVNNVNQSATHINDEKHIINIEEEFSKSQNVEEGPNEHQMKIRAMRNTVMQNNYKIIQNLDNTKVKGNQEDVLEDKFSENQLILKYMHKKFGQVNLKRKRSLQGDLDRNIASKSGLNLLPENR